MKRFLTIGASLLVLATMGAGFTSCANEEDDEDTKVTVNVPGSTKYTYYCSVSGTYSTSYYGNSESNLYPYSSNDYDAVVSYTIDETTESNMQEYSIDFNNVYLSYYYSSSSSATTISDIQLRQIGSDWQYKLDGSSTWSDVDSIKGTPESKSFTIGYHENKYASSSSYSTTYYYTVTIKRL